MTTTDNHPAIDKEALEQRYRLERDKRLRADGNEQYVQAAGEFEHLAEDPYAARADREPLFDDVDVVLVGGGFAGLLTAARLKQAGISRVRIIEAGGDFGGTWYWNRYPGAQCDVESYVYLPLLEETGYVPTEKYAYAPEILDHCRRIGRHFGLYDDACLSTKVTSLTWDDESARWIASTDRGDGMTARFVAMGTGPLNRPKLPGIPGLERFRGHTFHTSRWDYAYTGGAPDGSPLDKLGDKRVAIIGTGATAVQCVPHLGAAAEQLYVFQRTPSSVDVRGNRPTDPGWVESLAPGWQQDRIANFTTLTSGGIADQDLVGDGWTDVVGRVVTRLRDGRRAGLSGDKIFEMVDEADFEKMSEIRARVDEVVQEPDTAESLKAWYRQFCKRPCFHDEYLPTFNRPNVELVDTDGRGVDRITERGVVVGGVEYAVDCIIYATGFEVGTDYTRRSGFDLQGRDGATLSEHWADGMRSLHGVHVNGFPNAFLIGSAQGGFTANYVHLLEESSKTLGLVISHAIEHGVDVVEATAEAEQAWVELITTQPARRGGFGGAVECTPGYYNLEGSEPTGQTLKSAPYPKGALAFFEMCEQWRQSGDFEGLRFETRT